MITRFRAVQGITVQRSLALSAGAVVVTAAVLLAWEARGPAHAS
jgi:hypothetical protein